MAGRGLGRMPGEPGNQEQRRRRAQGAGQGEKLGTRAHPARRPIDHHREEAGKREQGQHQLEVDERPSEGGRAHEREERSKIRRRAERELRGREHDVDRRGHEPHGERHGVGHRHAAKGRLGHHPHEWPRDERPEDEEPDRDHQPQEHRPPGHEQRRRGRGLVE